MIDTILPLMGCIAYVVAGTVAMVWFVNSRFFVHLDNALGKMADYIL